MDGKKKKDMEIGEIVVRELACILPLLGSTRDTRTSTIEYRTRRKSAADRDPGRGTVNCSPVLTGDSIDRVVVVTSNVTWLHREELWNCTSNLPTPKPRPNPTKA
jgi:hypothetical protein